MKLHPSQTNRVLAVLMLVFTTGVCLFRLRADSEHRQPLQFDPGMNLQQVATANDIPLRTLLHRLDWTTTNVWELPRHISLTQLRAEPHLPERVKAAAQHELESRRPVRHMFTYVLWALLLDAVLLFVLTSRRIQRIRRAILAGTVLIFGVLLGASPNPMEGLVQFFEVLHAQYGNETAVALTLVLFSTFSLIGSKLICGWGCPLGALQELVFAVPGIPERWRRQFPFAVSLLARTLMFAAFLLILFGVGMAASNLVLFHHIDYFKIFRPLQLARIATLTLPLILALSLVVYRPFCQLVCPFGLYAWVLEMFAVNKPRILHNRCVRCEVCVLSCPTQAMRGIYAQDQRLLLPDCWSCGACIESCPVDAIVYDCERALADRLLTPPTTANPAIDTTETHTPE